MNLSNAMEDYEKDSSITLDDISNEITSEIFMFAYGTDVSSGIAEMYRCMGRVSKRMHGCCVQFLDNHPAVTLTFHSEKDTWMKHGDFIKSKDLKLAKLTNKENCRGRNLMDLTAAYVYILRTCETSKLESIDIGPFVDQPDEEFFDEFQHEYEKLVSTREYDEMRMGGGRCYDVVDIRLAQNFWCNKLPIDDVSNLFADKYMNLKNISIPMLLCRWVFTPVQTFSSLIALSDRLEYVCLQLCSLADPVSLGMIFETLNTMKDNMFEGLANLSEVIAKMQLLTKFTLLCQHNTVWGHLLINSKSLREIEVNCSSIDVVVGDCPCLRRFEKGQKTPWMERNESVDDYVLRTIVELLESEIELPCEDRTEMYEESCSIWYFDG